jgi:hypothetical protein
MESSAYGCLVEKTGNLMVKCLEPLEGRKEKKQMCAYFAQWILNTGGFYM